MKETILAGLPAIHLELSEQQVDTLCAFGKLLLEKNQVMNLTAITDPKEVARLHFSTLWRCWTLPIWRVSGWWMWAAARDFPACP